MTVKLAVRNRNIHAERGEANSVGLIRRTVIAVAVRRIQCSSLQADSLQFAITFILHA